MFPSFTTFNLANNSMGDSIISPDCSLCAWIGFNGLRLLLGEFGLAVAFAVVVRAVSLAMARVCLASIKRQMQRVDTASTYARTRTLSTVAAVKSVSHRSFISRQDGSMGSCLSTLERILTVSSRRTNRPRPSNTLGRRVSTKLINPFNDVSSQSNFGLRKTNITVSLSGSLIVHSAKTVRPNRFVATAGMRAIALARLFVHSSKRMAVASSTKIMSVAKLVRPILDRFIAPINTTYTGILGVTLTTAFVSLVRVQFSAIDTSSSVRLVARHDDSLLVRLLAAVRRSNVGRLCYFNAVLLRRIP